jgi:urease accessory protein
VKEAYSLATAQQLSELKELDQLCHALKVASESRKGSMQMGKQFIETVSPLTDSEVISIWRRFIKAKKVQGHYAIAYGMYASVCEFSIDDVLAAFLYSSTSSLVHNAVRAIPLGQNTGVQVIHALLEPIKEAVSILKKKTLDDVNNSSVGIELASMEHERLHARLFIS